MKIENPAAAAETAKVRTTTVTIETPLVRDGGNIDKLQFRRPIGGDFRGLSMSKLGQLDYEEIRRLAPRISLDGLIAEELDRIDGADQLEIAGALSDFLVPTHRRAEFQTS